MNPPELFSAESAAPQPRAKSNRELAQALIAGEVAFISAANLREATAIRVAAHRMGTVLTAKPVGDGYELVLSDNGVTHRAEPTEEEEVAATTAAAAAVELPPAATFDEELPDISNRVDLVEDETGGIHVEGGSPAIVAFQPANDAATPCRPPNPMAGEVATALREFFAQKRRDVRRELAPIAPKLAWAVRRLTGLVRSTDLNAIQEEFPTREAFLSFTEQVAALDRKTPATRKPVDGLGQFKGSRNLARAEATLSVAA